MKRLLALICMITCIFGLTACGSEEAEALSDFQQQKVEMAKGVAEQITDILLYTANSSEDEAVRNLLAEYTDDELAYNIVGQMGINADGYAIRVAIDSFCSALEDIGSLVNRGEATAEINGKQIIVQVPVDGEKKSAVAEIIVSNDMFFTVESAALNPQSTMGELMGRAALNTLIGMGTVFVVLILISLIISCFGIIPKIQAKVSSKKDNKKTNKRNNGIDNAVAQIVGQEESADVADDLELVAVIAAAIAASEGAASTDGFVVRSIRKVNRGRR